GGPRRRNDGPAGRRRLHPDRRKLQRQPGLHGLGHRHPGRAQGHRPQGRGVARHAGTGAPGERLSRRPGRAPGRRGRRSGVRRRAPDEIPLGRPSADSARRLRRSGGRLGRGRRPGRRARRCGDGEGLERVEGWADRPGLGATRCPAKGGRLMFYWLYEHVSMGGHSHVAVLNLLRYLTFRTAMSVFTAQVIVVAMGSRFIRWMQAKQGKGQPIRAEGIQRHVVEKAGTPTMGGGMILAGVFGGTLLWGDFSNVYMWAVLLVTAGYGFLGFLDDYAKVTKQSTDGISGRMRLALEGAIAMAAIALIIVFAAKPPEAPHLLTSVAMPLFK